MKNIALIAILAASTAYADKWETLLDAPQSGDRVVLNDREYVLFSTEDFSMLTNKITILVSLAHKQWNNQHKTEEGRRAWHGAKGNTTVTTNEAGRLIKVIEYADGYRHIEEGEAKRVKVVAPMKTIIGREVRKIKKETDIPKRLREARKGVDFTKEVK